jgi:hypothetical protein
MEPIISALLMGSSLVGIVIISLFIRFGCCCKCECMKKKERIYEIVYD